MTVMPDVVRACRRLSSRERRRPDARRPGADVADPRRARAPARMRPLLAARSGLLNGATAA